MKNFITIILLCAFFTTDAQITYTLTWTGNAGSSASAIMVIDETVCLQAGTCGINNLAALGVISLDLTITGGCAAGSYPTTDFTDMFLDTGGIPPNLTTDLVPQAIDINIFSPNGNLNGIAPNVFGACEEFSIVSAIPGATSAVPTLGEWGIIIFSLLLLNMALIFAIQGRRRKKTELSLS